MSDQSDLISAQSNEAVDDDNLVMGVGVEIVDIERFWRTVTLYPRLLKRVFTPDECAYCESKALPTTHYTLYFAAKLALLKVLGTPFCGIRFSTVEIARDGQGKPIPILSGDALYRADELGIIEMHLSLSYTHTTAVASAVALTQAARPRLDEDVSFEEKMAKAFNELRVILDTTEEGST